MNSRLAVPALLAGVLCIGSSPIFVRIAQVPGPVSAFWRVAIAAFFLVLISVGRRERLPPSKIRLAVIGGGFCFAADLALWNQSLLRVPVAICTVVGNSAPLWVGLGAWWLWRRRPTAGFWRGLAVAVCGMLVLAGPALGAMGRDAGGLAMALGASLFYSAYLLGTSKVRHLATTLSFTTLSTLASTAALLVFCLATHQNLTHLELGSWGALAGLGVISHLCGWLLINYALGHLPPEMASLTLLGQTLVAATLAIPILGEWPGPRQLAGCALVLVGIVWATRVKAD